MTTLNYCENMQTEASINIRQSVIEGVHVVGLSRGIMEDCNDILALLIILVMDV